MAPMYSKVLTYRNSELEEELDEALRDIAEDENSNIISVTQTSCLIPDPSNSDVLTIYVTVVIIYEVREDQP